MTNGQITALAAALAKALATAQTTAPKAASQSKSAKQTQLPFKRSIDGGLTERQIKNDSAVIRAFKKLGLQVKPRIDVMTYNMWLKQGRKVRPGQKAKAFVKGVGSLFTLDQTDVFHETKAELSLVASNAVASFANKAALDAEYGPAL